MGERRITGRGAGARGAGARSAGRGAVPLLLGASLVGGACGSAQPDLATPTPDPPTLPTRGSAVETSDAAVGAESRRAGGPGATSEEARDDAGDELLVGVEWRWVRFVDLLAGAIDISDPALYTVTFDEDGVVHVRADCKEGQGAYMADQAELVVRILRTTEDDCGETSLADEFVDNVNSASRFRVVDGELVISLRWDTGSMHFVPTQRDTPQESAPPPASTP